MKAQIHGSIRHKGTLYKAGQEEEFAAVATPNQIARLTEKKVISGDFTTKSKAPAEPALEAPAETEEVAAPEEVEEKPKKKR